MTGPHDGPSSDAAGEADALVGDAASADGEVIEAEVVNDDPQEEAAEGELVDGVELADDLAALTAQRDEYLGALQRMQADFDNYRKRVQRQQEETAARAAMSLVKELLPVLDALDLAQAHLGAGGAGDAGGADGAGDAGGPGGPGDAGDGAGALSPDVQALVQARTMLLGSLEKEGLARLDIAGVPFDPAVHDAVAHAPAEGDEGTGPVVDEVLRAGYTWAGQTLRPAMVRVRG